MRIIVKRSGGFAGMSEEVGAVETADLPQQQGERLEHLLKDANFFDLPANMPSDEVSADQFLYEITVSYGGREHTVTYQDDGGDRVAPLKELVDAVS